MTDFAVSTLFLKSSDLSTTENSNGLASVGNTVLRWNNINLRILLGDMYDEYETFNLSLTSIVSSKTPSALGASFGNSDINNLNLTVYIEGLPFLNNTYDVNKKGNTARAVLGAYAYPTTAGAIFYRVYNQSGTLTFGKSQEQCNITLTFKRISDDGTPETTDAFPNTNFTFSINGIRKASSTNSTRI
jgi:hypothetical protein